MILEAVIGKRDRLAVEARTTREMAPLAMVKGALRDESGALFAEASLKLYFE